MPGNTDKDLSLNKPIKMWKNIPIDSRQVTTSLNELDENITYPYIGMIFYSEFEDDYYKVLSLEDGYRVGRTGQITRASQIDSPSEDNKIPGYFIGDYEQYVLKGNTATMVKTAYIDQAGFLHIVFADNSDHNVGYVIGDPGFSPEITENPNNTETDYRLDIKMQDNITHLFKQLTTINLNGPKGDEVELSIEKINRERYICWKYKIEDDTWKPLISIAEITGKDGKEVQLSKNDEYIIWRYYDPSTETYGDWNNLIAIEDLKVKGDKGEDGDEIELRVNSNVIQWKLTSSDSWTNLISIEQLSGKNGKSLYISGITVNSLEPDESPSATATISSETETQINYNFTFNIPKGAKGDDGYSPSVTAVKENGVTTITMTNLVDGREVQSQVKVLDGTNAGKGDDGYSPKVTAVKENGVTTLSITNLVDDREVTTTIQILDGVNGVKGDDGYSPSVNTEAVAGGTRVTITDKTGDHVFNVLNGINGQDGQDGVNGKDGDDGYSPTVTSTPITNGTRLTITDKTGDHIFDILNGTDGEDGTDGTNGKNVSIGNVTTNTGAAGSLANVEVTLNSSLSTQTTNVYDFTFTIPKGDNGENGQDGEDGAKGNDGYSPTVTTESISGGTRVTITDKTGNHVFDILNGTNGEDGAKGDDGYSPTVTTTPITNGTRVTITDVTGAHTFNIMNGTDGQNGKDGQDGVNGKDGDDGYSPTVTSTPITNGTRLTITDKTGDHTFDILNGTDGQDGKDGDDGYSPTVTTTPITNGTRVTITDKTGDHTFDILNGEDGEAASFEIVTELPAIATAKLNTIYLLLTPEYQRGLNIGLTDDASANKNFFEEYVIIEDENTGDRSWELLAPQQYRISQAMIDYIWGVKENFTVYDDWFNPDIIPDYQKQFGDVTPLTDFIYRIEGNDLILVKYIGSGDVYLNISPYYKVNDHTYTSVKIDGTYDPQLTYYKVDSQGNQSVYSDFPTDYPPNIDENGVDLSQTFLTGPNVYSLYIADTIRSIKRVLIGTSNIPVYHIPSGITEIGDYAFYKSSNQTMVFERLSADGKTATRVGFESSSIQKIGVYACANTTNMRWLDDQGNASITLKTPASLKKISNYAFYHAGQLAHVNTTLSTNLYIGKGAFERSNLSAEQRLSSTTYYTDAAFLGYQTLYHDSNRSIGGGSIFFYDSNSIGYNYNDVAHTEASETDKLVVTLTSIDPTFES